MAPDVEAIRERAFVERRRPPGDLTGDRLWYAEDPVTECAAVGGVEIEAVGNLVAAVHEFDAAEESTPLLKTTGNTIARPSPTTDDSDSLVEKLFSRL